MNKQIIILSAIAFSLFTLVVFGYNQPKLIDSLNQEIILSQAKQEQLNKINETLKIERDALQLQIDNNSKEWHRLQGIIENSRKTINAIEADIEQD